MKALAVVSGYFGPAVRVTVEPPGVGSAYFFANAEETLNSAAQLGWVAIDASAVMPLTVDATTSSIQSKWFKFLGFLTDYPEFSDYTIIYADHKNQLTPEVVTKLLKKSGPTARVVVRHHAEYRDDVSIEVAEALQQPRYAQNMPATIEWLDRMQKLGFQRRTRVPNTGVILWPPTRQARDFAREVYEAILQLGQPECQIIWSIVQQKHKLAIRAIPYNSLGIRPKRHPGPVRTAIDRFVLPLRKFLGRV